MNGFDAVVSVSVIGVSAVALFVLLMPRVSKSTSWRATVTPLASIIGSGFLVLGPILVREFGQLGPLLMLGLCGIAYAFGAAVRFNIRNFEPIEGTEREPKLVHVIERASSWALAGAYIVSVAYYLNLLGAFAVSLTPVDDRLAARLVTTTVLVFIGVYGLTHGLKKLEDIEEMAVSGKLSIIAGLLLGMGLYLAHLISTGDVVMNHAPRLTSNSLFVAFGLVICVQGFETSRYLGERYDPETRVRTMKWAQGISAAIYLVYVGLMAFSFDASQIGTSETAIIDVTRVVAPVLPAMLVAAALTAQFSAAVADTVGCGGLVRELSAGKIKASVGYAVVCAGGVALTWMADIYQIIAYASRAFAVYYALQSATAATLAFTGPKRRPVSAVCFIVLTLAGIAIAVFGVPAD